MCPASSKAVAQRCSVKKVFLEIPQNSQENTCAEVSFLIKLKVSACYFHSTLLRKRLWQRCFPVNFAKFLGTSFLKEHIWWLLRRLFFIFCRTFSAKLFCSEMTIVLNSLSLAQPAFTCLKSISGNTVKMCKIC